MYNGVWHISLVFWCLTLCVAGMAETIYVDADAKGENNGLTWADAYANLSLAIQNASPGDQVWVAEGTYDAIVLKDAVKVYGGFAGNETAASEADPDAHKTYISGGGKARAVEGIGNGSSTVLRGFHIIDGFIDFPDIGGGAYLENSGAMFVNCVFTRNRAGFAGGAVAIWGGSPTFVNCRFYGNDGGWTAGAIFNRKSATPSFVNCLFYKNAASEGGAVSVRTGHPMFINCTFSDNKATVGKGGAFFDTAGQSVLRNSIVWNNSSPDAGANEIHSTSGGSGKTSVTHSVVKGGWPGEGNLDKDPLFVDAANGDYRIQGTSPCRDKGQNALLPADVADLSLDGNTTETLPMDLNLKARIYGDSVDMGAFEWHP